MTSHDGRLGDRRVKEQNPELVGPDSGNELGGVLEADRQAVGDRAQQHIARHVAEPLVDGGEVVEVDEHHGRSVRTVQLFAQRGQEARPVGQTSQRIVICPVAQLVLQRAISGDVAERQHRAGYRGVRHQVDGRELHHPPLAVGVHC